MNIAAYLLFALCILSVVIGIEKYASHADRIKTMNAVNKMIESSKDSPGINPISASSKAGKQREVRMPLVSKASFAVALFSLCGGTVLLIKSKRPE